MAFMLNFMHEMHASDWIVCAHESGFACDLYIHVFSGAIVASSAFLWLSGAEMDASRHRDK